MDYNVKPMIHRFRQNGMNIVMDVNSGIVHVVDDVTYKVLEFYNGKNRDMVLANLSSSYDEKELNEVMDDLDELIQKEVLLHLWIPIIRWPLKTDRLLRRSASTSPMTAISAASTACRTGRLRPVAYAHAL